MEATKAKAGNRYATQLLKLPDKKAIPFTLKLIGQAIKNGSKFPPIVHYARALATTAPPKNYYLQIKAIYDDVLKNWRYVKDPYQVETLATDPQALYNLVLGKDGRGVGKGKGAGDCDDITAALGALLRAVGFPLRIVTSAPPGRPGRPSHVFLQAHLPLKGWLTVDPVLHPQKGLGEIAPHSTLDYWDLEGNQTGADWKSSTMEGIDQMNDYQVFELSGVPEYQEGDYLPDWSAGLGEWGCDVGRFGYVGNANDLAIELSTQDLIDAERGLYLTPILAMKPSDIQFVEVAGAPLYGMQAQGDNGWIYEWTKGPDNDGQLGGKFRDFFRKVGRGIKKGAQKVGSVIKKGVKAVGKGIKWVGGKIGGVLKKTAFGRFVLRVKDKIVNVAMKIVKPIAKFVGKWAPKIAPVAALIPGVGPAISGALTAAGKVAKLYNKYGAVVEKISVGDTDGTLKPFEKIQFPNAEAEARFKMELAAEAKKMEAKGKEEIDRLNAKLRATPLPGKVSPFQKAALAIQKKKAASAMGQAIALAKKSAEMQKKGAALAKARGKAMAEARRRKEAGEAASRAAKAEAATRGAAGAAAAAAAKHAAEQQRLAKLRAAAVKDFKKAEAKKPKKQKFKDHVGALKKLGYRVKVRKAA